MKKVLKVIGYVLLLVLVFVLSLAAFSTRWALNTFAFINFDEILFQLTSPIESASSAIIGSFISDGLLLAICFSIVLYVGVIILIKYISCKRLEFDIQLFKKNYQFSLNSRTLKVFALFLFLIISSFVSYVCLDKITFIDYVKAQSNDSSFIKDNYVYPKKVKLTFPEKKRNLIYIYVESLESSFFSSDLGGIGDENYLEPLVELTGENINFSDTELYGGAVSVTGTTWTSGAIVAHTSGLPFKMGAALLNDNNFSSMLDKVDALGNILDRNGYNQMFMMGSDKNFGNRGIYLKTHGDYDIYDYYTAISKGKISEDYYEWWGFEDSKLFEYAKEEATRLSRLDEPFNLSLLTVNTHATDGFIDGGCPTLFDSKYGNSIYCSSLQVLDFVNWIKEQDFYDNTTVVIVGDHISMQDSFYPGNSRDERRVYNLFINSLATASNSHNRKFTTMDFFPTTLASLGVEIEGDKLGLGTNLFSDKKTLIEEVGYDTFEEEITKYSSFYMDEFVF